eukprot:jgi/Hompol1/3787/HPOL_006744-RA
MNVEAVLACILPYHETKQFAQFVRILAIPTDSRFHFLKASVQKTGVQLDRSLLVERINREPAMLQFVFRIITKSREDGLTNTTLTSFFACVVIQYLQAKKTILDNDILAILPFLIKSLEDSEEDLRAAGQMIIAFLSTKTRFANEALGHILESVVRGISASNLYATLLCMVTICQNQPLMDTLPLFVVRSFIGVLGFPKNLVAIAKTYNADNFIAPFLKTLVESDLLYSENASASNATNAFVALMTTSFVGQPVVRVSLEQMLESYVNAVINSEAEKAAATGSLLRQIYEMNAELFDNVIESGFKVQSVL